MIQATSNEVKFAAALMETGCQAEAYRRAYNAENMSDNAIWVEAHRVANRPKVALMVNELKQEAMEQAKLSKEWVISKLIENAERALQATEVVGADGRPCGVYKYEGNVANRALELLGKEQGMFKDSPSTVVNVDSSPSDLSQKVETARKALNPPADRLTVVSGGNVSGNTEQPASDALCGPSDDSGTTEPDNAA